jgi:hypothetical protein
VQISQTTREILEELARKPGHDEVKSHFGRLLTEEFGADLREIGYEKRVPEVCGRIDALIGRTVFEAKRDLDRELADVERRMPDYLSDRERETGEKFFGIASDGKRWIVYEVDAAGNLFKLKETSLEPEKGEQFLAWLDGAIAIKASLPPDPLTIKLELGGDSVAFRRASEELLAVWREIEFRPATALKKELWKSLLKLVYGRDIENDKLWIQHTYLVIVAKSIALAVLELADDEPDSVMSGRAFRQASIFGAVESDFFDWVVETPGGVALVRKIMAHVRRFRLREVESDVLKVLYESLIDAEQRHGLGEYYTPDWLAAKVVRNSVSSPTQQKVLDPACGSGTFLFHAVRNFVSEAHEVGFPAGDIAGEATSLVAGTDIHPVAVIIARVTYLLALAPVLGARQGAISIPVYLGDAMQLSVTPYFGGKELSIRVPPPPAGDGQSGEPNGKGGEKLDFPETFCRDPGLFDKAIQHMQDASEQGLSRHQVEQALDRIVQQHYRRDATKEETLAIKDLGKTYELFDSLRREDRDSVWAYVARNLSRPLFFSSAGGWANVLVGNPPWVAFRHMSADLQKRFKELAKEEGVYVGGKLTTQNDLCALFAVRAAAFYLRPGGKLAFVLPLAALTRGQFEKFRTGKFTSVQLRFDETGTMDETVFPLFPVPACAVFATRRRNAQAADETIRRRSYSGTLPFRDAPEQIADQRLTVNEKSGDPTEASYAGGSVYREAFRQGATLVPRFLCFVERKALGRLRSNPAMPLVVSRRSPQEKEPWKSLPSLEGNVEREFLRPVLLGESILPYRQLRKLEAVIPLDEQGTVLNSKLAADRGMVGLANWLRLAEIAWQKNRNFSTNHEFIEQIDYFGKLSFQTNNNTIRFVYCRSGTNQASSILMDGNVIVYFSLYWCNVTTIEEGLFLMGIFNSETTRGRVSNMQSRGQWGARDFAKVIFNLPIPLFDPRNALHKELARAAGEAEEIASHVELPEGVKFQRARKLVRDALKDSGVSDRIDALVARLLP